MFHCSNLVLATMKSVAASATGEPGGSLAFGSQGFKDHAK